MVGCYVNKGRKALTGRGRVEGKRERATRRVVVMMTPFFGRTSVVCIGRGRTISVLFSFP